MTRRRNWNHLARALDRLSPWGRVAVGVVVAVLLYFVLLYVVPVVLGAVILWVGTAPVRDYRRRERRKQRAARARHARLSR